jgi:hypothetical protein
MSLTNDNIKKIDINTSAYVNNNSTNVNSIKKKEVEEIDDNLSNESFSEKSEIESVASSSAASSLESSVVSSENSDEDKESIASSSSEFSDELSSDSSGLSDAEFGMGSETAESSTDTIDKLSADPLFLVLSNFLSSGDENIVDALLKINKNLEKLQKGINKSLKLKSKKSKTKHHSSSKKNEKH